MISRVERTGKKDMKNKGYGKKHLFGSGLGAIVLLTMTGLVFLFASTNCGDNEGEADPQLGEGEGTTVTIQNGTGSHVKPAKEDKSLLEEANGIGKMLIRRD